MLGLVTLIGQDTVQDPSRAVLGPLDQANDVELLVAPLMVAPLTEDALTIATPMLSL